MSDREILIGLIVLIMILIIIGIYLASRNIDKKTTSVNSDRKEGTDKSVSEVLKKDAAESETNEASNLEKDASPDYSKPYRTK